VETRKPELRGKGTRAGLLMTAAATVIVAIVTIVVMVSQGIDSTPRGSTYPEIARIPLADAHALAESGDAVIVDVRSQSEYLARHVAGSLGLPEAELAARLDELPRDRLIITYCA
jgi:hypothetical protein